MKLSILICTVVGRETSCEKIINELVNQISKNNLHGQVEILVEIDDCKITVGTKRNILKNKASGEYICFIDDDDMVSEDYLSEIFLAIESNPEIITFQVQRYKNGNLDEVYIPNIHIGNLKSGNITFMRNLLHLCPHKKHLVDKISFPDKNFAEDFEYSMALANLSPKDCRIDKNLYLYYFSEKGTLTQK